MIILDQFRQWLDTDKSVKMVADDMQITSELILLVRVVFADGIMKPEEIQCFKEICKGAFGIPEKDLPQVFEYLKDIGYETSVADAAAMFQGLDMERKQSLLLHMLNIAKSDHEVKLEELEIIRRTAGVLGVDATNIASTAA